MGNKVLSPIAFGLLLGGVIAMLGITAYELVSSIVGLFIGGAATLGVLAFVWGILEAIPGVEIGEYGSLFAGGLGVIGVFFLIVGILVALSFLVVLVVYLFFMFMVLRNRTAPRSQAYLIFMLVIAAIYLLLNFGSIFTGNWIALVGLTAAGVIVAGFIVQVRFKPDAQPQIQKTTE